MKKIILSLIILAAAVFLFWHFFFSPKTESVRIDGTSFQVELAISDAQRYQGLSGRRSLCPSCGMLFEFQDPGIYPFTMRGMNFPLDMVWINGGKIVAISQNVPISQQIINPNVQTNEVLELNSGTASQYGFKVGDGVE